MKLLPFAILAGILSCGFVLPIVCSGQSNDTVNIPRSRLQELERKEAELNAVKGVLKQSESEKETLKQQRDVAEKEKEEAQKEKAQAIAAQPQPEAQHVSPPIESLPPLQPGAVVDAMDLGNYFATDAVTAKDRFGDKQLKVRGTILRFEPIIFSRTYQVFLKTTPNDVKLECGFYSPDRFTAVFTVKAGAELVGLQGETQVPLAHTGQDVIISGRCRGFKKGKVSLVGCTLEPVR